MPQHITDGLETLLALVTPDGRPTGGLTYPRGVTLAAIKVGAGETALEWFRRCVNTVLESDEKACAVEPNLAVFADVRWRDTTTLTYANVQVLKTQVALADFYCGAAADEAFLLRLDWDCGTLGPMFTHALPHVHTSSFDAAPRFGIDGPWSANVLVEFFEFVYRHLFHEPWLAWVRQVWHDQRDPLQAHADPIENIIRAFKESNIALLRSHRADVELLKRVLRAEKEAWCPLRADADDLALIRYPD